MAPRPSPRLAPLALAAALAAAAAHGEEVVVIVNKDNPHAIDRAYVGRIYTGALRGWPDGTPVQAFDQAEDSEPRQVFNATVLGKSAATLRAIWSQNIFTGKGLPPRVATPDTEMKRAVAANRNAIGYIRASQLDGTVRALPRQP